jgi:hypothetical protein
VFWQTFDPPPADQIIGYVTTGSLSLARGHGYGIGSISLLSLLRVMRDESDLA